MRFALRYVSLFIVLAFIYSCQRELNIDTKAIKNSCPSSVLVKVITKTNTDSLVTEFENDANGRPSRQFTAYIKGQEILTSDWIVIRNASGIIVDLVTKTDKVQGSYLDTVHVFYDYTLNRYSHTVQRFDLSGFITKDSIVFIYDAANKLIGQHIYLHHFTPGPYYLLDNKHEYTYNSDGNVSKVTNYERDQVTNVIGLRSVLEFTYDNKKRPRQIDPREAAILAFPNYASHNLTIEKITDAQFPVYSYTNTYQYIYNECDKPATMVVTSSTGNYVRKLWYYYK